jgi:hypothetical protein
MKKYLILLLAGVLSLAGALSAQTPASASQLTNIYAAGASYNVGATPAVAGTGLYAHLLVPSTSTYAFTAVDVLPTTVKPFTVNTNFGAGIAQKLVTIGNVAVYLPTAAGISFNGTNTGWQWNTGGLASIHLKGNYYLMPNVRVVKSSVTSGTGYQPIIGVLFGWGQ